MAPGRGSKIVFVGNVPYDKSEEQLAEVFSEVGKVVDFRLIFDNETGKPKGYGFCEFEDPETAASAVRNLNGASVGGRQLRVSSADGDPKIERAREQNAGSAGLNAPTGPAGMRQWGSQQGPPVGPTGPLPQGMPLPPGMASTDAISQTLAAIPPDQLLDILGQMRAFVTTSPDQAKNLLQSYPQLAYALFQAMLMMNIVDPAVLQRMMTASAQQQPQPQQGGPGPGGMPAPGPGMNSNMGMGGLPGFGGPPTGPAAQMQNWGPMAGAQRGTPPPGAPMMQQQQPMRQGPPGPMMGGPHGQHMQQMQPGPAGYGQPMPPRGPQGAAPAAPAAPPAADNLADSQRQLLNQVLSLTQAQIDALPADQRATIMQLRAQFQT